MSLGLALIWLPGGTAQAPVNRFGEALAHSLALSSAGHLLHRDRIELADIANRTVALDEVAGVMFFNAANEIIAISGNSAGKHHTAPATLDDTITGYVSVVLNAAAFAPPPPVWRWAASLALGLLAPFASLLVLQLSSRGQRSLPIVSVPETPQVPETCYCIGVNLHNQMALDRAQKQQAIADALDMGNEVCAIHQGLVVEIPLRGIVMVLGAEAVSAGQAVSAGFLINRLLSQFETAGQFRCYVSESTCPGSPRDLTTLSREDLNETTDIDALLTLAALAKPESVLLHAAVYEQLAANEQELCSPFVHPLLDDITDAEIFSSARQAPTHEQWVENQAHLILGFNQASA